MHLGRRLILLPTRVLSLRIIVIVAALSVVALVITLGAWVWIGVTNDQYSQLDRRDSLQRAPKLITFAILADDCRGKNLADAQCDEVVQNSAGTARLAADPDDVVHRQIRFDRDLLEAGVDFKIAVETDVSDQRDTEFWVSRGDLG